MKVLRTPDERFSNLPDYPFAPHYLTVGDGLRLHYVDEGPRDAPPVLMLHGEPTWSYLYRHMITRVAKAGFRVLAPDLVGFGKSDKPSQQSDYSYAGQVGWITDWLKQLDLRGVSLVCQDWGSLIGLRLAAENSERFARVFLANGGLPVGDGLFSLAFGAWKTFAAYSPVLPVSRIVQLGTKRHLSEGERAAYEAPFPSADYKAAARVYPSLVPIRQSDPARPANLRAWDVFERWTKPFICCFSDGDPITRGQDRPFRERVPGAREQEHRTLHGGHFLQEDDFEAFSRLIVERCAADLTAGRSGH